MWRWLILLIAACAPVISPGTGMSQAPDATLSADNPSSHADCADACHRWLMEDRARTVTVDVPMSFSGRTRRVAYAADWIQAEPCPPGRVDLARKIVGVRQSSAFLTPLLGQGFCPRASINGIANDAPYLASRNWEDVVFDAERARMLTREEYRGLIVPPIRQMLTSQEPIRWLTFSLLVGAAVQHADLLASEISAFLADPGPSSRQETRDGGSAKLSNVVKVADGVTDNIRLVQALLDDLDSAPTLTATPGYRRLIDNLAGITSSMPTWGSPPVCANAERIARHLPWARDSKTDATYLATLTRCRTGSESLLRSSLQDGRPVIVATALRVWWANAAAGHPVARTIAPDVVALVMSGDLPDAAAAPVHVVNGPALRLIRQGTAAEDAALGLSALGLLSDTIERLDAAGRSDQSRALRDSLEQGLQRLPR